MRQAAEAITLGVPDPFQQVRILRKTLHDLAELEWQGSPPEVASQLHRIIRNRTGCPDPYRCLKERMNRLALDALPECRQFIAAARDPRQALIRLVVAANWLDCGVPNAIDSERLPPCLANLWDQPMVGDPEELFHAAAQANRILFLADNAGEIIFDRLLIEALPMSKITVAVRGKPVLNDALREDAALAGITALVSVIDNGSDAPGTVLADCSAEFRAHFRRADLIIAKGQGNYETLSEVHAPIFFLFSVKCRLVARQFGHPTGTLVANPSPLWAETWHPDQERPTAS